MYDVGVVDPRSRSSRRSQGVGQVVVGGGALPAVRVDVNPTALNNYGLGLEDVRTALAARQREPAEGRARRTPTRDLVARDDRSAVQGRRTTGR